MREVREGFQVHDVRFKNKSGRWMEDRRNIMAVYQSKAEAIAAVKESDRGWFECVAEDLEEQRERQRIETRLELSLAPCYDRAHLVDDWLRSAWCGSSRAVLPTAERAQQEPEISR